ncbi:MAG TPA: B-box zinc finger protein [Candidatus Sulfotelmatobacter sp.]|nr:B-box zinc finger protein [Candidatus Sulfotelmatobacter sp.]
MNCANHSDQAAVAFCRTCGKPLCPSCTRDVRGVIYCEACLAARMEGAVPAPGFVPPSPAVYPPVGSTAPAPSPLNAGPNPAVAGILAGFFPFGVGAVYCSQYAKGLAHLIVMVLLIIGVSSDVPWYMHTILGVGIGFFYVYQIIDGVRTAKAIQTGEPVPDPFGLAAAFGAGEKFEGTKVPIGAAILIGLGILFLLHTAGLFEVGMGVLISLTLILLGVWLFAKHWGLLGGIAGRCACEQCRARRLMGPAMLITLGVLFLLDSVSSIEFHRTWPAILLVIGVVKLFQSNASSAGHVGPLPADVTVYPPAAPPPPPSTGGAPNTQPPSSGEVNHV